MVRRVFVIVLDSFGIGREPDAEEFGDGYCNTLASIAGSPKYYTPNLEKLGLFNIDGVDCRSGVPDPLGSFARLRELSRGKDTTVGHWELAGVVSENPLPTYPDGFPGELVEELEAALGRRLICNLPYSGTAVIHDYGEEHERTGALIAYTSADSVFQIAAHEEHVPVEQLYAYCRIARQHLRGKNGVGRVIARPFEGSFPNYRRTSRRHDFSLEPPGDTMLDALERKGLATIGVGKIADIFAGRGISRSLGVNEDDVDGMRKTLMVQKEDFIGLCFVNLVDFDMKYGHRRDIDAYAENASRIDLQLGEFMEGMRPGDVLMITGDHGCDPGAPGTDHTREYVPLLIYGDEVREGVNLGTYPTYAMLGATVADIFCTEFKTKGESFWQRVRRA